MLVKKAYKYRIYPTKKQRREMAGMFGSVRFVYNYFLARRIKLYTGKKESLSYLQMSKELTALKKENSWLYETGSQALQQSIKDLNTAYDRFFRKIANFPKFKNRRGKQSMRFPQQVGIDFENEVIKLPLLGEVRATFHRRFNADFTSVTLSKTKTSKYFVSVLVEEDVEPLEKSGREVGIDVGLKDLMTLSDGEVIHNPRWFRSSERNLSRLNKKLSRQQRGSNSYGKTRLFLAKQHEEIANQRKDFHHKLSRHLVEQYDLIVLEDLNFQNMSQSLKLGKSVGDAGLGMLVDFVKYKSDWYGKEVKQIDRWYPSSKLCSDCGYINKELKLSDRTWICIDCGVKHDRDLNAARNILNYFSSSERATVEFSS